MGRRWKYDDRITPDMFRQIIKDTIRERNQYHNQPTPQRTDVKKSTVNPDNFDFDDIFLQYSDPDFEERAEQFVNESLIKSYNAQSVANIAKRVFGTKIDFCKVWNKIIDGEALTLIVLAIPNTTSNPEVGEIEHFLNRCGYFKCQPQNQQGNLTFFLFEPKFGNDISDKVRKKYRYLYHATPSKNLKHILEKGLIPKGSSGQNSIFLYPDRVYCMRGDKLTNSQMDVLRNVQKSRGKHNPNANNEYTILKIDVAALPPNISFCVDPMVNSGAIYTYDNIPPTAISIDSIMQEATKRTTITESKLCEIIRKVIETVLSD